MCDQELERGNHGKTWETKVRLIVGTMGGSVFGTGRGEGENDLRDPSWNVTYWQPDQRRRRRLKVVGRCSMDDVGVDGVDNDVGTRWDEMWIRGGNLRAPLERQQWQAD